MSVPFLVIAGATSSSGKTTLTAGVIAALRQRGLVVQPFKVGPDYIDPTYHRLAAGRPCRNFDTWMVEPAIAAAMARRAAADADLAVVEGVMGLFDGASYDEEIGSTAQIAKLLGAPVVVVLDVGRTARSAGALALGFQQFDPEVPLTGFIANRCGSADHAAGVRRAIERATGLPVLGWLPEDAVVSLPSRHLGLVPLDEDPTLQAAIARAGDLVERCLDLDRLLQMARLNVEGSPPQPIAAQPSTFPPAEGAPRAGAPLTERSGKEIREQPAIFQPRIAIARDAAFSFYYEDNLDLLRAAGAQVIEFSPLRDESLPPRVNGLYLGGGFPELYAARLSANRSLHSAIRMAFAEGLPIYAECGGFMFLAEAIIDAGGERHPMVGLVPGMVTMQRRRVRLGYCEVRGGHWLLPEGTARGHEFHWSSWGGDDRAAPAFAVQPRTGTTARRVGYRARSLVASYVHLHFASNPALAPNFVATCRRFATVHQEGE